MKNLAYFSLCHRAGRVWYAYLMIESNHHTSFQFNRTWRGVKRSWWDENSILVLIRGSSGLLWRAGHRAVAVEMTTNQLVRLHDFTFFFFFFATRWQQSHSSWAFPIWSGLDTGFWCMFLCSVWFFCIVMWSHVYVYLYQCVTVMNRVWCSTRFWCLNWVSLEDCCCDQRCRWGATDPP